MSFNYKILQSFFLFFNYFFNIFAFNWRLIHYSRFRIQIFKQVFIAQIYFRNRLHLNYESCSFSLSFTFYFDFSAHFFYQMFADAQAQASSFFIASWGIRKFTKIKKQFIQIFFGYTHSWIFNAHLKWNIVFLKVIIFLIFFYLKIIFIFGFYYLIFLIYYLQLILIRQLNILKIFQNIISQLNLILINFFLKENLIVSLAQFNSYSSILWGKFECIWNEIQKYLWISGFIPMQIFKKLFNLTVNN